MDGLPGLRAEQRPRGHRGDGKRPVRKEMIYHVLLCFTSQNMIEYVNIWWFSRVFMYTFTRFYEIWLDCSCFFPWNHLPWPFIMLQFHGFHHLYTSFYIHPLCCLFIHIHPIAYYPCCIHHVSIIPNMYPFISIWVNYNVLTTTSLGIIG